MHSINVQIFFMEGVPEAFVVGCMQNNFPNNAILGKLSVFCKFSEQCTILFR